MGMSDSESPGFEPHDAKHQTKMIPPDRVFVNVMYVRYKNRGVAGVTGFEPTASCVTGAD